MGKFSKVFSTLLVSGTLISGMGTVAQAAGETGGSGSSTANTTGKTEVNASFTKSDEIVNPVDPTDPSNPGEGGGNGATPGGDLSLIYVTSKLDFGTHEINVLDDKQYSANDSTSDVSSLWNNKAVIEVSDVRGTNAGWTLSVSGNPLQGKDGSLIKGASLALPQGVVSNAGESNGAYSVPVSNALSGDSATVLSSKKDSGAGVTVNQLEPNDIKLEVPANSAKAQEYTSTLNWTLSDTPGV